MSVNIQFPYLYAKQVLPLPARHLRPFLLLFLCCTVACRHRDKTLGFYYWKTVFTLDSVEKAALAENAVHTLYIRFFDVDWAPGDTAPSPVAPVRLDTLPAGISMVPVVYIRNRVFEQMTPAGVPVFAARVAGLVREMATATRAGDTTGRRLVTSSAPETQFDCDWTEGTKARYFAFLEAYRRLTGQTLSATIRLHQVKYPDRSGIPPVNYGVLMFYNMGPIDAGNQRSIYEKATAIRYIPALPAYPLTLDVALPFFAWGIQIRDQKAIRLLDKMDAGDFDRDTGFLRTAPGRYVARYPGFRNGFYFREGDEVKIEAVSREDLLDMVRSVNRYTNHRIRNLIFYDLDASNLLRYDKNVFQEVLAHTD